MLVDLEAGKPLEMPWLQGRMVVLGDSAISENGEKVFDPAACSPLGKVLLDSR